MDAVAIDAGWHIRVAFAQSGAMDALAIFFVNRIVAQGAAFRDPDFDVIQQQTRLWIVQLAHFMCSVAVDAQSRFAHTLLAGCLMRAIFGEITLLAVAARADFIQLLGNVPPVRRREFWMGIFSNCSVTLDAGITELPMDRALVHLGRDVEIQDITIL